MLQDEITAFILTHCDMDEYSKIHENEYVYVTLDRNNEQFILGINGPMKNDESKLILQKKNIIKILIEMDAMGLINDVDELTFIPVKNYLVQQGDDKVLLSSLKGNDTFDEVIATYFAETDEWFNNNTGLTDEEEHISNMLVDIWNTFVSLPTHHPQHQTDVGNAIHQIQHILQSRTCHRLYPNKYPIKRAGVNNG